MSHCLQIPTKVCGVNGEVVGFGGLVWYSIPSKGRVGVIEEVVVLPEYRGNGLASKLMAELLKLAKEMGLQKINLTTADLGAKKLYEKFGFTKKEEDLMVLRGEKLKLLCN